MSALLNRRSLFAVVLVVALVVVLLWRDDSRDQLSSAALRRAVTIDGMSEHLRALDRIARENDGTRFTGTSGYARSVDYVAERLEDAGLDVERHDFRFYSFSQNSPTRLSVGEKRYRDGVDMNAFLFSGGGEVRGDLRPVDFDTGGEGPACDGDALDDELTGDVVLVRPGPCLYRDQVQNLTQAGAAAVLFVFPDTGGGRLFRPTLFSPEGIEAPVLGVPEDVASELADAQGEPVEIEVDVSSEPRQAQSVVAETPGGDGDEVVMVGGHLDSVLDGPGINDNGSGVAALLEIAEELAGRSIGKKVRFAFWGGEELGLLGSSAYVRGLRGDEVDDISAYLNFDMVASPNFVRFVYSPEGAPEGSAEIAGLLTEYFDGQGLVTAPLDLEGRSDHGPFIQVGVPVGGLFTGAEDPKSEEEAELFGGDVGVPHDHCYHQACDTLENIDRTSLDQMADAIAHAVAVLAG